MADSYAFGEWSEDLAAVQKAVYKGDCTKFFVAVLVDSSDESKTAWENCFDHSKFKSWCQEYKIAMLKCDADKPSSDAAKFFLNYVQSDIELPCFGVFDGKEFKSVKTVPSVFGIDTFRDGYPACGVGNHDWEIPEETKQHVMSPIRIGSVIDAADWNSLRYLVQFYVNKAFIHYGASLLFPAPSKISACRTPAARQIVPNELTDEKLTEITLYDGSDLPCSIPERALTYGSGELKVKYYEYVRDVWYVFDNDSDSQKYEIKLTYLSAETDSCYCSVMTPDMNFGQYLYNDSQVMADGGRESGTCYLGHRFYLSDMKSSVVFPCPKGKVYLTFHKNSEANNLNYKGDVYFKFTLRKYQSPETGGKWEYSDEVNGTRVDHLAITYKNGASPGVWTEDFENIRKFADANKRPVIEVLTKDGGCGYCVNYADRAECLQSFKQKARRLKVCLGMGSAQNAKTPDESPVYRHIMDTYTNLIGGTGIPLIAVYSAEEKDALLGHFVGQGSPHAYLPGASSSSYLTENVVYVVNLNDGTFEYASVCVQLTNSFPYEKNLGTGPYKTLSYNAEKITAQDLDDTATVKRGVYHDYEKVKLVRKNWMAGTSLICKYDVVQHWYKFSAKKGKTYKVGLTNYSANTDAGYVGVYETAAKAKAACDGDLSARKKNAVAWAKLGAVAESGLTVTVSSKKTLYLLFTRREATAKEQSKEGAAISISFYFTLKEVEPETPDTPKTYANPRLVNPVSYDTTLFAYV